MSSIRAAVITSLVAATELAAGTPSPHRSGASKAPASPVNYPSGVVVESCNATVPFVDSAWWQGWGGNVLNNHWAAPNAHVDSAAAKSLAQHCKLDYMGGVSATPTVEGDIVYYLAWNGMVYAVNYKSCQTVWKADATGIARDFKPLSKMQEKILYLASRTSAIIEGDVVFFGTQPWALALAFDKHTGALLDRVQLNPHPFAVITLSPTAYQGYQFWGTSSREEAAARKFPEYDCCSFVGNMVATTFNHSTNKFSLSWNVSTLPLEESGPNGWAGGAVWGSQPSIDVQRSQVFYGTGNVYRLPPAFEQCRLETANISVYEKGLTVSAPCLGKGVFQESVLALDIETGYINWYNQITPIDAWTAACGLGGSIQGPNKTEIPGSHNCPYKPGPDADFGMAPTFVSGSPHTPYGKDLLVIGQKDGNMYGIDAQAGRILWATKCAPDGNLGGISFGIAVDDTRAYFVGINSDLKNYTLVNGDTINVSAYGAVDITDGSILWQTASPSRSFSFMVPTVVNDVAFMGYTQNGTDGYDSSAGALVPVDAATGKILEVYDLDAPFHGGIAVQGQYVMFGAGYHQYKGTGSLYVYKSPEASNWLP
ncbi:hypothetical protein KC338_g8281 [Hortaea werneckii]|nr:hypothetical protein KC338_g8281 [Hortaea werneckii]